jgi:hypothetical protein
MPTLQDRLSKISQSPAAKEIKQQRTVVREPIQNRKPGPKNTWKDPQADYVRLYTQLQKADRNLLKREVVGGALGEFESVDHFINEAIIRMLNEYGLECVQGSTVG